jgi:hypothetical protein
MYLFNSNLRVGDIILVRGAAKHSKIIANLTNGHFSHAMIALENDVFLEAITGSGVQTTSSLRVSFKDKANVVVLRCMFPNKLTETNSLEYITKYFAEYQGRNYSYKGAIASVKETGDDHTKGGYFCSHLVAAIYKDAGFPLLNKPVYKITPNELLNSEVVEEVTDQVISPYSDIALQRVKNKNRQINCIDAGGGTLSKDAQNHQKLLKDTAKYFTRNRLATPQKCSQFAEILTNPKNHNFTQKLDYQISKKYKKIGVNEYIRSEMSGNDFELDMFTVMSEIDRFGYDHAKDIYGSYSYLLISSSIKFLNGSSNINNFQLFYDEWHFKYFALKVEYHTLIVNGLSNIMEHYLDVTKSIEDKFPDCFDELQEIKTLAVTHVISKQVEPEQKAALVKFLQELT